MLSTVWPRLFFQGNINEKQKSNEKMEKLIENMSTNCDDTDTEHDETLAVLQDDIQKIKDNIQVGPELRWLYWNLTDWSVCSLVFFSCQGDQSGAVSAQDKAGGGGQDGPEGEESQPGSPQVHQVGDGRDGRGPRAVRQRPDNFGHYFINCF